MLRNYIPTASIEDLFSTIKDFHDLCISSSFFAHPASEMGVVYPYETLVLAALVKNFDPSKILEFGTSQGRSTLLFADNSSDSTQVHTLDLKENFRGDYTKATLHGDPDVGLRFERSSNKHKITQHFRTPTERIPTTVGEHSGTYDFIFVDAAHDYESVKNDTQDALELAATGSMLLWHDFYIHQGEEDGVFAWMNDFYQETDITLRHIAGTFFIVADLSWDDDIPGEVMNTNDPKTYYMPMMIYNAERTI